MVSATVLNATTSQTLTTTSNGTPAHTHMITLTPANLTTLRGGGMVQIESTNNSNHTHTYQISCT